MLKKVFLLTTAFLFLTILSTNKAYGAKLYLEPPTGSYETGKQFQSRITLDTEGAQAAGADAYLTFDKRVLKVVNIVEGKIFDTYIGKDFDNENGTLSISGIFSLDNKTGFNGKDVFATIVFEGVAPGTSKVSFDFSKGEINDSNVAVFTSSKDDLTSATGATYTITQSQNPKNPSSNLKPRTSNTPTTPSQLPKSGNISNTLKSLSLGIGAIILSLVFFL
jgi:hypothetical protein